MHYDFGNFSRGSLTNSFEKEPSYHFARDKPFGILSVGHQDVEKLHFIVVASRDRLVFNTPSGAPYKFKKRT